MELPFHNYDRRLVNVLRQVRRSDALSPVNKKLILSYADEMLACGLSRGRVARLTYYLIRIAKWLEKDFPAATVQDIKRVVAQVETSEYAPYTKKVYKLVIRRLYKWVRGAEDYPAEVKWISLRGHKAQRTKLPEQLLTEKDVQALINAAMTPRDRAFVAVLYETGARVGEVATRKLRHVTFDQYGARVFLEGKTGSRSVRIVSSVPLLKAWINVHPARNDPSAYLWPTVGRGMPTYTSIRSMLDRLAKRARISKPVHPHLFRHSRATVLASHFTEAQMKAYFGWVQGSEMAAVYVHLSGRDVDDAVLKLHGLKKDAGQQSRNRMIPIDCVQCNTTNPAGNKFCSLCGLPLGMKSATKSAQDDLRPKEADDILDEMLKDPNFNKLFRRRLTDVIGSQTGSGA